MTIAKLFLSVSLAQDVIPFLPIRRFLGNGFFVLSSGNFRCRFMIFIFEMMTINISKDCFLVFTSCIIQ